MSAWKNQPHVSVCEAKQSLQKRAHFTLVELLVVIAIISILAGMLLPALSKAMGSAQTIACANKLKQLEQGALFYTNDYRNYVLPAKLFGAEANVGGWYYYLQPYLGEAVFSWSHSRPTSELRTCDANPLSKRWGVPAANLARNWFFGWYSSPASVLTRYTQIKRPSRIFGFSDANEFITFSTAPAEPMVEGNLTSQRHIVFPHDNKGNVSHLDGHVSSYFWLDMFEPEPTPSVPSANLFRARAQQILE